jgi:7-keto-8-aminopelargonate synthetase-like enzyme
LAPLAGIIIIRPKKKECNFKPIGGHFFKNRGTEEYFGLSNRVDIINSTLGKALGGAAGGYTTGPKELIHLLRQRSRPYLFSNSLPPPVVAVAQKVCHFF